MRYLSVCSGIEAASVAWHPLGWTPAAFSEIENFPRAVLAHRWPGVPLHGDFTTIRGDEYGPIDLLVGGTPCQSFSVAGLRGGLDDERGNLALEFLRLADRARPKWLVWENVPGVLSSNGGRDFGSILGGLVELGYGFAYRVLDAQFFGIPQRRRRVFVVGCAGDWRGAAAVLFERHSLSGNPPPSREKGEGIAPTIASRPSGGGGLGTDFDCDGGLISCEVADTLNVGASQTTGFFGDVVSMCLNAHPNRLDAESETLIAFDTTQITSKTNRCKPQVGDPSHPLAAGAHAPAIAFGAQMSTPHWQSDHSDTLQAKNPKAVATGSSVRRLTPRECERLQGFPDDYTLIAHRGKSAADGPRYKALGNSMAVPVMAWIGRRIEAVNYMTGPSHYHAAAAETPCVEGANT